MARLDDFRQARLPARTVSDHIRHSTLCNRLVRRRVFLAAANEVPPDLLAGKVIHGEDTFLCLLTAKHARSHAAIADFGYRYLRHSASVTGRWPRFPAEFQRKVEADLLLFACACALLPNNLRNV
jgi:hypothetical protein